ncbi:uncharacterized protein LOC133532692 [Cydia pomonella]|uniref:uncharacterized protein LOC133532692 n=1 Tax=Cydia pomonella TaxID=82600 RepID=UPI002ADDB343|nr:uncharacterized protein LOC133532692 [Cydia pomonella]
MKTLNPGEGMMSRYINNAIPRKNKFTTKFSLSHLTNTYPSHYQSKHVSTTEETNVFNKKRRPNFLNIDIHLESTQLYAGKPGTQMKHTNDNNEMELSRNTKQYFTKGKSKSGVPNIDENKTEKDESDKDYMSIEGETTKESKDSSSDAKCSSEDTESQENIDQTVLSPLRQSEGGKKHQKHLRNHHHRHRHKHGHKHSHYRKRKYENLKRKYLRLKEILAAQKVNYSHSRPEENKKYVDINRTQTDMKDIYSKSSDNSKKPVTEINYSPSEDTTPAVAGHLRVDNINLFLDDYNIKAENSTEDYTIRNYGIYRKSFPLNTTVVFEASDSSDAEKELKENIHDTIRHMDFVNNNVSRRSYHNDNSSIVRVLESPETDVEAVLKSNIYKAVKKLLKK